MATGARRWRACTTLLVLAAANAAAANWTVTPDITLRETYTNNVFLGSGTRSSDFITQVTPGIRIDGRSSRLIASLDYRPSALFYARNDQSNDVVNNLAAFGKLEAVEKFLFIDATGSITQNFISPFAARPAEIATVTPNRFESRTFSFSPYLRGELGLGRLEYELRNRNTWTSTDNDAVGDAHTRLWSGRLASPVRLFGWALEFDDTRIDHEESTGRPDEESRLYRGRLYYQPDPSWRFSASAGREENNFVLPDERERHTIRGAGVSWQPSPRTSANFEYESRFFGPSRLASFTHRTRLTAWSASYSRNTSNFQEEVLRLPPGNVAGLLDAIFAARIPDPIQRRAAVDQFLRATGTPAFLANPLSFFTQRVFLREALDASFGLIGVRNSITFTVFRSENTRLSSDAAVAPQDAFLTADRITLRGFGTRVDHKLTPFTTVGASATRTWSRQEGPASLDSRNDYFALTLNHTVSARTTAFAGASVSRFDSEDLGLANQDAKSVFVGVNHRF